jgi:hybrid cluster-associated redox disulfide protein
MDVPDHEKIMKTNSKQTDTIDPNITVEEFLRLHPDAVPVFIRHRMICVGCWMSRFDTLEDVAWNYNLDMQNFLNELTDYQSP